METKVCGTCKINLLLNETNFFKRKIKQRLSNGESVVYASWKSDCKTCHGKKGGSRRVKKRCEELNCSLDEYRNNWKAQYSKTRTKDFEARQQLRPAQYGHYLRWNMKSIDEYKERVDNSRMKTIERLRSMAKARQILFTIEDYNKYKRAFAKKQRENLIDSYIANNILGVKMHEISKEQIHTKRLIIQLKKEIKNGNK